MSLFDQFMKKIPRVDRTSLIWTGCSTTAMNSIFISSLRVSWCFHGRTPSNGTAELSPSRVVIKLDLRQLYEKYAELMREKS
ncbi:MAG: hypothetical protein QXQ91_04480 [Nanopusillaceae archaeon]